MTWRGRAAGFGVVAALGLLIAAGPVRADAGPHSVDLNSGTSGLGGDCASCHRAHTASAADLLTAEVPALCTNCHNGTKATTDVVDGLQYAAGAGIPYNGGTQGSQANVVGPLRGGGFSYALMDTSWTGSPVSRPVSSSHAYSGETATIWGNAASGAGKSGVVMTCTNCHNPHGDNAYRILRTLPTGSDAVASVVVPDEPVKVYTVSSASDRYFGQLYGTQAAQGTPPLAQWQWMYRLDQWCVQCHTRYEAVGPGSGTTSSGDAIFKYKHMTIWPTGTIDCNLCHVNSHGDIAAPNPLGITGATAHEPVCETCHVAHGTAATMQAGATDVAWPDGSTTPSGNARSSLLRLDNRGVCQGCHDPTAH